MKKIQSICSLLIMFMLNILNMNAQESEIKILYDQTTDGKRSIVAGKHTYFPGLDAYMNGATNPDILSFTLYELSKGESNVLVLELEIFGKKQYKINEDGRLLLKIGNPDIIYSKQPVLYASDESITKKYGDSYSTTVNYLIKRKYSKSDYPDLSEDYEGDFDLFDNIVNFDIIKIRVETTGEYLDYDLRKSWLSDGLKEMKKLIDERKSSNSFFNNF